MKFLLLLFLMPCFSILANTLVIKSKKQEKTYSTEELWNHPSALSKKIPLHNYPDEDFPVRIVPVSALLKSFAMNEKSVIKFHCLDGFSGVLEKSFLTQADPGRSRAYIAIESQKNKWPLLPKKGSTESAGPFYLIWENPEKDQIPANFWPYQLSSLEIIPNGDQLFPKMRPVRGNERTQLGFKFFQRECMACHKMNGEGTSDIGPDLNLPMSPLEYFQRDALKKFLRNPQSVRKWSSMKMVWVERPVWQEGDLDNLLQYFEHMVELKSNQ